MTQHGDEENENEVCPFSGDALLWPVVDGVDSPSTTAMAGVQTIFGTVSSEQIVALDESQTRAHEDEPEEGPAPCRSKEMENNKVNLFPVIGREAVFNVVAPRLALNDHAHLKCVSREAHNSELLAHFTVEAVENHFVRRLGVIANDIEVQHGDGTLTWSAAESCAAFSLIHNTDELSPVGSDMCSNLVRLLLQKSGEAPAELSTLFGSGSALTVRIRLDNPDNSLLRCAARKSHLPQMDQWAALIAASTPAKGRIDLSKVAKTWQLEHLPEHTPGPASPPRVEQVLVLDYENNKNNSKKMNARTAQLLF